MYGAAFGVDVVQAGLCRHPAGAAEPSAFPMERNQGRCSSAIARTLKMARQHPQPGRANRVAVYR